MLVGSIPYETTEQVFETRGQGWDDTLQPFRMARSAPAGTGSARCITR